MKSMKKLMLVGLTLLAVMMVILPLVGCDSNAGSGNTDEKIIVFKTPQGYFFPLVFTFNTVNGTVEVDHPVDGKKYGTYTGNLNQNGTITMIEIDESGERTFITGTISDSGKTLTANLPKINIFGPTVLIRQ